MDDACMVCDSGLACPLHTESAVRHEDDCTCDLCPQPEQGCEGVSINYGAAQAVTGEFASSFGITNTTTTIPGTLHFGPLAQSFQCPGALLIRGQHVACDWPYPHDGWAHSNRAHEVIWR